MEDREEIWESQIYQSSFFDKEISELKFSQSLFASIYLNNAFSIDNLFIFLILFHLILILYLNYLMNFLFFLW